MGFDEVVRLNDKICVVWQGVFQDQLCVFGCKDFVDV